MIKYKVVKFIIGLFIFLIVVIAAISGNVSGSGSGNDVNMGTSSVSSEVSAWKPLVEKYAKQFDVNQYVNLMLALIQQESGGTSLDVMQASEGAFNTKYPKIPNSIVDPDYSVFCGVQEFKVAITKAGVKDINDTKNISLALQTYNFGEGFISFAKGKGGYSLAVAQEFSKMQAKNEGCSSYGDVNYVAHVFQYYKSTTNTNSALEGTKYADLMKVALKYEGQPYVFGGSSPSQGFDCSGIVQYAYGQVGIKLNRTAQNQYDQCTIVPANESKPGDLVFFKGTYDCPDLITHIGIYVGNNKMYQSGGHGLGYIDLTKAYYQQHLVGIGRINK